MSNTIHLIERRVRQVLRDLSPSDYAVRTETLWETISRVTHRISGLIGVNTTWNVGYQALSVGTSEYTLATAKYADVIAARGSLDGRLLWRTAPVALELQRQGSVVPSRNPQRFALLESTTQTVQLRLDSKPTQAETLDLLAGFVPDCVYDVLAVSGPQALRASVIPFAEYGMRALDLMVASECARGLVPGEIARLGLNESQINAWASQADDFINLERQRKNKLVRPSEVVVMDSGG